MKTKSFNQPTNILIDEAWQQVEALASLCKSFSEGQYVLYKNMSVTLRTLLVGSSGYPPLVKDVLPKSEFYPLQHAPIHETDEGIIAPAVIVITNDQGGELHYYPGGTMPYLGIEDGGVVLNKKTPVGGDVIHRTSIKNLFNVTTHNRISLDSWMYQPFLRANWTITSFIKCVAHKDGGAHIDNNKQLKAMQGFGNIQCHLTERISSYIVGELKVQLNQAHPNHDRIIR